MADLELTFRAPDIVGFRGSRGMSGEGHINWYVDYASEPDVELGGRVVFSNLHAVHDGIGTDVTVAATIRYDLSIDLSDDEFEEAFIESDAAEDLWDATVLAFGSLAGAVRNRADIPHKAPVPELSVLSESADGDDDAGSEHTES